VLVKILINYVGTRLSRFAFLKAKLFFKQSKLKTSEVKQVIQDFRPGCCKNKDLVKGENQVTSNCGLTGLEGQYAIVKLEG
jgi:hypothetical protein